MGDISKLIKSGLAAAAAAALSWSVRGLGLGVLARMLTAQTCVSGVFINTGASRHVSANVRNHDGRLFNLWN